MKHLLTEFKPLSEVSTLGIGGLARYYVEVRSIEEMQQVLLYCSEQKLPYFILGKGSNCLFDSKGLNRVVIHNKIEFCKEPEAGHFYVGAGYSFSLLGTQTAKKGWLGLEVCLRHFSSCGGAVFMNASGARHCRTGPLRVCRLCSSQQASFHAVMRRALHGYRFSIFQKMKG